MEEIRLINLTPHEIVIVNEKEKVIKTIPSSGAVRCNEDRAIFGMVNGVPIVKVTYSDINHLIPEPEDGVYLIVGKVIAEQLAKNGRSSDILLPDRIVRDTEKRIIGCKALSFV